LEERPAGFEERLQRMVGDYEGWLDRQPLSANTGRTYRTRVRGFLQYLAATPAEYGDPLADSCARDYAARDYKRHLKTVAKAKPSSVNLSLAAIDNFYRFLGMGKPDVAREDLPGVAPGSLAPEEQKRFLRAVERSDSPRDRAMARVLFFAGIRVSELVGLDSTDVSISARKGRVVVRSGKGDAYREVALNSEAREALERWLAEREGYPNTENTAVFLNYRGGRLSSRAVNMVVRRLGEDAGIEKPVSAHVLRHTCMTNLVRAGNDLVMVAEIAGHRRLETTRRYSLPSEADREAAMEGIRVEY
jgi:site-specific recombinase XerD